MKRRKRNLSHVNHERWLVSYADFVTLLFAFFVVLYLRRKVDDGYGKHLIHTIRGVGYELSARSSADAGAPPMAQPGSQS